MRAGEIYRKLVDRHLELQVKALDSRDEEDRIYTHGFYEAIQMVYELIVNDSDDDKEAREV